MDIKEIALRVVVDTVKKLYDSTASYSELTEEDKKFYWTFAEALIAELAKQNEPVARICSGWQLFFIGSEPIAEVVRKHGLKIGDGLYTFPPTAEQIANETAEACAKYVNRFLNGDGIQDEAWIRDIESGIRRGTWKEFKE